MKLEARVKQDYRAGSVTAFSGREFVRYEWRPVPAGFESQAKSNPLLDVRAAGEAEVKPTPPAPITVPGEQVEVESLIETTEEIEAPARRGRRRRREESSE